MLEEVLGDWRGTRGGAGCGRSGMVAGKEPVGEGEGEEELGGSDGGSGFVGYLSLWEGVVEVGEEDSILGVGVGVEVVGSRLVGKDRLMGSHSRTS